MFKMLRGLLPVLGITLSVVPALAQHQTWIRHLGTPLDEVAIAGAPDGAGGAFLGGATRGNLGGPPAGGYDAWLARFNAAGNSVWIRQFGATADDAVGAAASDGLGGVYVGGGTYGSLGGTNLGGSDAWLARYDAAGNQLWIRHFGTGWNETVYGAAPDGSGGVYLCGMTEGNLGGPSAGLTDAWVTRYDGAGNQLCSRQLGT